MSYIPALLVLTADNNDDFDWAMDVGLPGVTFPLTDVIWHMQVRRLPGDVEVVLELLSADNSITMSLPDTTVDPPKITLAFFRPASAVASLTGIYVTDLKMIRGGRRAVIASGTVTFAQGITIDT